MAGWTRNPFRPKPNEQSPGNDNAQNSSAIHRLEATIELEEHVTGQVEVDASPERAPNATESPTDDISTSHLKRLRYWWSHNVRLNLEHGAPGGDPRDYLALERTFLGWFRTSVTLISFGVVITQLFVLKDLDPTKGKILGAVMSCGGAMVVLLGCARYFRQQRLLTQGKALSGGWHHQVLILLLFSILITLFVLVIVDS